MPQWLSLSLKTIILVGLATLARYRMVEQREVVRIDSTTQPDSSRSPRPADFTAMQKENQQE